MKKLAVIISFVGLVTIFMGFNAQPASALICCSVCDENPNNPACRHGCSQSCVIAEESFQPDGAVEDDAAQVCYLASSREAP